MASFELHVQESQQIAISQKQSISAHGLQALHPQKVETDGQKNTPNLLSQIIDTINEANIDLSKLLKRLPQVLRQVFEAIEPNLSDKTVAQLFSALEPLLKATPPLPEQTSPRIDTAP